MSTNAHDNHKEATPLPESHEQNQHKVREQKPWTEKWYLLTITVIALAMVVVAVVAYLRPYTPARELRSGIDLSALDRTVRPQDDLFRHVNGTWLRNHHIPEDRSTDGEYSRLSDLTTVQVKDIVEKDSHKPGALYRSFMNTDAVERAGATPIAAELSAVENAITRDELASQMGAQYRAGVSGLIRIQITGDAKNSSQTIAYLGQSGIGLPDSSYYTNGKYAEIFNKYQPFIARMLTLSGISSPQRSAASARQIVALERTIAALHWDIGRSHDLEATYNRRTLPEAADMTEGFPLRQWISAFCSEAAECIEGFKQVIIRQPSFFEGLGALWLDTDLDVLKSWMSWNIVLSRAPYLTSALNGAAFDFYGKVISGTPHQRPRWQRGVSLVNSQLGDEVGKQYVKKHFPAQSKERITTLVAAIIESYRTSISSLSWMQRETRINAVKKLDALTVKIGYPDKWKDYSGYNVDPENLMANIRAGSEFSSATELGKLGKKVDKHEWGLTPQTVNAYYHPVNNEIVFPAAILQAPFFDASIDDAANFGGIGAVIGHEIGHAFDNQGSKYDSDGHLREWWTAGDRARFNERAERLVKQYNRFIPSGLDPKYHVDGKLTLGENLADLGGLTIAIAAYKKSLGGKLDTAPYMDGMTGIQRLFFNWSTIWRSKSRPAALIQQLVFDPHAPEEFRTNGTVRNIPEFYEAFNITPSDKMWLDPKERVQIWS